MVCLNSEEKEDHHEFQLWPKDFPKGLRVLLLYDDANFATQTKIKLEQIDYVVSMYRSRDEALDAISENAESFHVAILEVTSDNCHDSFKFLESAQNLPIIVASSDSSLSTMMKCISLGATEFLQKPLSEEKLRNIWQHVVHKAFSSGWDESTSITKSLKPIKEMVVSMLQLKHDENIRKTENETHKKLKTPSKPQLENKSSSTTTKKEDTSEVRKTSTSVEKTCNDDSNITPCKNNSTEEMITDEVSKSDRCSSVKERNENSYSIVSKKRRNDSLLHGSKGNKKKSKVDWTPELHKKFVKAVEQLGIDQAIPSKILDLMKVEGLTRHNIASHLQKYRMHRRHISPKDEENRWPHSDHMNMKINYMQRPIITPYPPTFHHYNYYSNIKVPSQPYASYHHLYPPPFQPWQHHVPLQGNSWQCMSDSYQLGVEADTWGCPVYPPNFGHYYPLPPRAAALHKGYGTEHLNTSNKFCLIEEEEIEKVVKEAMAEPWGRLPIGLTPPSSDSVLSELHRLGIRSVPSLTRPDESHLP
ncbi:hypothetical protein LUZ60_002537 [Juncus effusus]|nr:hypothetical protein LUZ60_002537 [Juncus effusus]